MFEYISFAFLFAFWVLFCSRGRFVNPKSNGSVIFSYVLSPPIRIDSATFSINWQKTANQKSTDRSFGFLGMRHVLHFSEFPGAIENMFGTPFLATSTAIRLNRG